MNLETIDFNLKGGLKQEYNFKYLWIAGFFAFTMDPKYGGSNQSFRFICAS